MSRTWLVAMREYRQYASTRAFRLSLILVPLIFVVIGVVQVLIRPPDGNAFMLYDRTGRYGAGIERQVEAQYQQQVMMQLAAYARRWNVALAPLTDGGAGRRFDSKETAAFIESGGLEAALGQLRPRLPPAAPAFTPPARRLFAVAPPAGLGADATPEAFAAAIRPSLADKVATPAGRRPLALAIYIPDRLGQAGVPIRLWTNGGASAGAANELTNLVWSEMTRALRLQALEAHGIDAADARTLEGIEAPIMVIAPPRGEGAGRLFVRSIVPMAFAYLLMLTTLISGQMLLQGTVEERSSKLLETVLACVSPRELMGGKLLGIGAVGLTLVFAWVAFAMAGAHFLPAEIADLLRPALASLGSPLALAGLVFYFLSGYLLVAMLFLAIGAMSDSLQDAQGYLMPVIMLITVPTALLMTATLQNPGSVLTTVMSWIPPYTPYAMLMRLGAGIPAAEVLGTSVLLILFLVAEFVLLGRVFRANLLRTGQPPRLRALVRMMLARS